MKYCLKLDIYYAVDCTPASDIEPVRHGHWVNDGLYEYTCSECGKNAPYNIDSYDNKVDYYHNNLTKYCPNCGAKMDKGGKNMREWISVEDRLPEKQSWNHVAILDTKTGRISVEQDLYAIETAENFKHKKGFCKDGRFNGREVIIAWMPFPKPPTSKQVTSKRKPAIETCLFCGRKIPDRSNAETIREFVRRFKQTARKTTLTEFNTVRAMTYSISPQELDALADKMIEEKK